MANKKVTYLFIDTSYLKDAKANFGHPDFMELLRRSNEDEVKIFISQIAWEERRTQLVEEARQFVGKFTTAYVALNRHFAHNIVCSGLEPASMSLCTEEAIDASSKESMNIFAKNNKIKIISLAYDHAERAWQRYFDVDLPFNPAEIRENRRKDIPDSWILEAAIDSKAKHPELMALCGDGKLSNALAAIGVSVFKTAEEVLKNIDSSSDPESVKETVFDQDAAPTPGDDTVTTQSPLEKLLGKTQEQFKHFDARVLGYVGYLGSTSKDQLFTLLSQTGMSLEVAKNVAERLVIAGVITDTGNHYLPKNKEAAELAATEVEPEIIKLLGDAQ